MRMSELVGKRYKERPAEATLESHAFLLRGGYARQVANGIYSLLPPGLRIIRKIEAIVRQEMERIGGQEVQMPVVQPRELWDESGRFEAVGPELCRFKDRTGHDMVLAMTHEEAVVHLCRNEISSHTQLPFMVFQIQTKFRDEPRSRGGLIRVREFTMKDGYSFHVSQADLESYYQRCYHAYERIFARAGMPNVVAVEADSGMMGGAVSHEFMMLTEVGEDTIVTSEDGTYIANQQVATGVVESFTEAEQPLEKVETPGKKTIEDVAAFLGVEIRQTAKAVFYENDAEGKLVLAIVRGDREVNEAKLSKVIQTAPVPASDERIKAAGAVPGYASPMALDSSKVRIIVDPTVRDSNNLVTGANEEGYHYMNFNLERDAAGLEIADIISVQEGDKYENGNPLHLSRGIEVGNIFQLGTKYTSAMGMTFDDADGAAQTPIMGCYGIGIGRMMSSIMEARRDKFGPQWPMPIAPWHVHLNALKLANETVRDAAEKLYQDLTNAGIEVLYDDRNERPGVQFADADLLGIPVRLIVGERNLANGDIEIKRRDTGETTTHPVEGIVDSVKTWIAEGIAEFQPAD